MMYDFALSYESQIEIEISCYLLAGIKKKYKLPDSSG
jgi:hypothetical protein